MVLEQALANFLSRSLPFVDGLDRKAVELGVWRGDVRLKGLRLKKGAVPEGALPGVAVVHGTLGELRLKVPWRALGRQPVEVVIDSLYVLMRPSEGRDYDPHALLAAKRAAVEAHFDTLRERHRAWLQEHARASSPDGDGEGRAHSDHDEDGGSKKGGLFSRLGPLILRNLVVSIGKVHVAYTDETLGVRLGAAMDGMRFHTVDGTFSEMIFDRDLKAPIYKLVALDNLSVFLLPRAPAALRWDQLSDEQWEAIMGDWASECEQGALVRDLSAEMRASMPPLGALSRAAAAGSMPNADLKCELPALTLRLGADQHHAALRLVATASQRASAAQYDDLREALLGPAAAAKVRRMGSNLPDTNTWHVASSRARWKFACACARRRVQQETRRWSFEALMKRRETRLRYIEEYLRVLDGELELDDSAILVELESELSVSDIILYRSRAIKAVRERQAQPGADDSAGTRSLAAAPTEEGEGAQQDAAAGGQQPQRRTWFGWLTGQPAQGAVADKKTEAQQVREELLDVVDALELSASDSDEPPSGDAATGTTLRFRATIGGAQMLVLHKAGAQGNAIMDVHIADVTSCLELQGPRTLFTLRSGIFGVVDCITPHSAFPRVCSHIETEDHVEQEFVLAVTTDTRESKPDVAIDAFVPAVAFIWSGAMISTLAQAFSPPLSEAESSVLASAGRAAAQRAASIERRTAAQLVDALNSRMQIQLSLRLASPLLVVPRDATDATTPFVAMELGTISAVSSMVTEETSPLDSGDIEVYDSVTLSVQSAQLAMCTSADVVEDAGRITSADIARMFETVQHHILRPSNLTLTLEKHVLQDAAISAARYRVSGTLGELKLSLGEGNLIKAIKTVDGAVASLSFGSAVEQDAAWTGNTSAVQVATGAKATGGRTRYSGPSEFARAAELSATDVELAETALGLLVPAGDSTESSSDFYDAECRAASVGSTTDAHQEEDDYEGEIVRRRPAFLLSLRMEGLGVLLSGAHADVSTPYVALLVGAGDLEVVHSNAETRVGASIASVRLADLLAASWTTEDVTRCIAAGKQPANECSRALIESKLRTDESALVSVSFALGNDARARAEIGADAKVEVLMECVEVHACMATIGAVARAVTHATEAAMESTGGASAIASSRVPSMEANFSEASTVAIDDGAKRPRPGDGGGGDTRVYVEAGDDRSASMPTALASWRVHFECGAVILALRAGTGPAMGVFDLSGVSASAEKREGDTKLWVRANNLVVIDGDRRAEVWRTLLSPIGEADDGVLATFEMTLLGDERAKARSNTNMDCLVEMVIHGVRVVYLNRFILDVTAFFLDPAFWTFLKPTVDAVAEAAAEAAKTVAAQDEFKSRVSVRVNDPLIALPQNTESGRALTGRASHVVVVSEPDERGGIQISIDIAGLRLSALDVLDADEQWWHPRSGIPMLDDVDIAGCVGVNYSAMASRRAAATPVGVNMAPAAIEVEVVSERLSLEANDECFDTVLIVSQLNFTEPSSVWADLLEGGESGAGTVEDEPSAHSPAAVVQRPSTRKASTGASAEADSVSGELDYHVNVRIGRLSAILRHKDVALCDLAGVGLDVHVGHSDIEHTVLVGLGRASGRRVDARDVSGARVPMIECPSAFAAGPNDSQGDRAMFLLYESDSERSRMQMIVAPVLFRLDPMVVLALSQWSKPPTRVRTPSLSFTTNISVTVSGLTLFVEDVATGAALCSRAALALNYNTGGGISSVNFEAVDFEVFVRPSEHDAINDITILQPTGAGVRVSIDEATRRVTCKVELQPLYVSISFAGMLASIEAAEAATKATEAQIIQSIQESKAKREVLIGSDDADVIEERALPKRAIDLASRTEVAVNTPGIKIVVVDDSRGRAVPLLGLAYETEVVGQKGAPSAEPLVRGTRVGTVSTVGATTGVLSIWMLNSAQALWEPILEPVTLTLSGQRTYSGSAEQAGVQSRRHLAGVPDGGEWTSVPSVPGEEPPGRADSARDLAGETLSTSLSVSAGVLDVNLYQPALSAITRALNSWTTEYRARREASSLPATEQEERAKTRALAASLFCTTVVQNYAGVPIRVKASGAAAGSAVLIQPLESGNVPHAALLKAGFGASYSRNDTLNAASTRALDIEAVGFKECKRILCKVTGSTMVRLLPATGRRGTGELTVSARVRSDHLVVSVLSRLCVVNTCAYPCRIFVERVEEGTKASASDARRAVLLRRTSTNLGATTAESSARESSHDIRQPSERLQSQRTLAGNKGANKADKASLSAYHGHGLPKDEALVDWFSCGEDLGRLSLAQGLLHITRTFVCFSSYLPGFKPRVIPAQSVSEVSSRGGSFLGPKALVIECFDQAVLRLRNFRSGSVRDDALAALEACRQRASDEEEDVWTALSAADSRTSPPDETRSLVDLGVLRPGEATAVPPHLIEGMRIHLAPGHAYALNDSGLSSAEIGLDTAREETLCAEAVGVDVTLEDARRVCNLADDERVLAIGVAAAPSHQHKGLLEHHRLKLLHAKQHAMPGPSGVKQSSALEPPIRRASSHPASGGLAATPAGLSTRLRRRVSETIHRGTGKRSPQVAQMCPHTAGYYVVTNKAFYFAPSDAFTPALPSSSAASAVTRVDLRDVSDTQLEDAPEDFSTLSDFVGYTHSSRLASERAKTFVKAPLKIPAKAARTVLTPEPKVHVLVLGMDGATRDHPGLRFVMDRSLAKELIKLLLWLRTNFAAAGQEFLRLQDFRRYVSNESMPPSRHMHNCRRIAQEEHAAERADRAVPSAPSLSGSSEREEESAQSHPDVVHVESIVADSATLGPPFGGVTPSDGVALSRTLGAPATVILCAPLRLENLLPCAVDIEVRCGMGARVVLERRRLGAGEVHHSHSTPAQSDTYLSVTLAGFEPSQAVIVRPSLLRLRRGTRRPAAHITVFETRAAHADARAQGARTDSRGRTRDALASGSREIVSGMVGKAGTAIGKLATGVTQGLGMEAPALAPKNLTLRLLSGPTVAPGDSGGVLQGENGVSLAASAWIRNATGVSLWVALAPYTTEEDILVGAGRPTPVAGMQAPLPPGGSAPVSLAFSASAVGGTSSDARAMRFAALAVRGDGGMHEWSAWQPLYPRDLADADATSAASNDAGGIGGEEGPSRVFNTLEKPSAARHPWRMIAHTFALSLSPGPGGALLVTVASGTVVRNAVGGVTLEVRPRGMGNVKPVQLAPHSARSLQWDATVAPAERQLEVRVASADPRSSLFESDWSPTAISAMRPDTYLLLKMRPRPAEGSPSFPAVCPVAVLRAGVRALPTGTLAVVFTETPTLPYAVQNRLWHGRRLVVRQADLPVPWQVVPADHSVAYCLESDKAGAIIEVAAEVLPDMDAGAMAVAGGSSVPASTQQIAGTLGDGLFGRVHRVDLRTTGRRTEPLYVLPRRTRTPHPDVALARFDVPHEERLIEAYKATWIRPGKDSVRGTLFITPHMGLFDSGGQGPRDAIPLEDVASVRSYARREGGVGEVRVSMRGGHGRARMYVSVPKAAGCAQLLRSCAQRSKDDRNSLELVNRYSAQRYHCKVSPHGGGGRTVTFATTTYDLEWEEPGDTRAGDGEGQRDSASLSGRARRSEAQLDSRALVDPSSAAARSTSLSCFCQGVGLSLIDRDAREIAYMRLTGVRATATASPEAPGMSIEVAKLQLDNQLLLTKRPVIATASGSGGMPAAFFRGQLEGVLPGERPVRDNFEEISLGIGAPVSIALDVGEIVPQLTVYFAALFADAQDTFDAYTGEAGQGGVVSVLNRVRPDVREAMTVQRPATADRDWWAQLDRAFAQQYVAVSAATSGRGSELGFVLIELLKVGGLNLERLVVTSEAEVAAAAAIPAPSARGGVSEASSAVAEAAKEWQSALSVLQLMPTMRGSMRLPGFVARNVFATPARVAAAVSRHYTRSAMYRGARVAATSLVGYGALEQALTTTRDEAQAMRRRTRLPRTAGAGGACLLSPFSPAAAGAQAALAAVSKGDYVARGERYVDHAACVETRCPEGRFYLDAAKSAAGVAGATGAHMLLFVTTRRTLACAQHQGKPAQPLWEAEHGHLASVSTDALLAPNSIALEEHSGAVYQATFTSKEAAERMLRTIRLCT